MIMVGTFALVFGPSVLAQFARQDGPVGFGYGYGYGYGFGHGWDAGTYAGYRTTEGDYASYLHGFGFGLMLSHYSDDSVISYVAADDRYEIGVEQMPDLAQAGILVPDGTDIESTTSVEFTANLRIYVGYSFMDILSGTTMTAEESTTFAELAAGKGSQENPPDGETVRGSIQLGLPDLGLTVDPAVTMNIHVGSVFNGQELDVFTKEPGEDEWSVLDTCVVASGKCAFETTNLSDFITTGGTYGGGGGSSTTTWTNTTTTVTPGTYEAPSGAGASSQGAMSRAAANEQLPEQYPVDSLVKVPNDNDPTTDTDATVYYIGLDAKRHPFLSSATFLSWYSDFSEVQSIDLPTLTSIPLGAPILVRPGTHWVKVASDPKTYYVDEGYELHWIQDETAALALGGSNWNANIIDVDPSIFTYFTEGGSINSAGLAAGWPTGALVRAEGDSQTYYVTDSTRRPFASSAAMTVNKFQERFVEVTSSAAGWMSKVVGSAISGFEDALFSLMH